MNVGARIATPAIVALVLAGCGAAEDADVVEMSEGEALFVANCAECHGVSALGDGPLATSLPTPPPSLMDHLGHHPEEQLIRIIRTGLPPAMPPAPLSEDEVRLVIDYAWTLVPDSLVDGLREMQRMAEMGMDMDMGSGEGPEMDAPMDTMRH